jgi:hypothetical protein
LFPVFGRGAGLCGLSPAPGEGAAEPGVAIVAAVRAAALRFGRPLPEPGEVPGANEARREASLSASSRVCARYLLEPTRATALAGTESPTMTLTGATPSTGQYQRPPGESKVWGRGGGAPTGLPLARAFGDFGAMPEGRRSRRR